MAFGHLLLYNLQMSDRAMWKSAIKDLKGKLGRAGEESQVTDINEARLTKLRTERSRLLAEKFETEDESERSAIDLQIKEVDTQISDLTRGPLKITPLKERRKSPPREAPLPPERATEPKTPAERLAKILAIIENAERVIEEAKSTVAEEKRKIAERNELIAELKAKLVEHVEYKEENVLELARQEVAERLKQIVAKMPKVEEVQYSVVEAEGVEGESLPFEIQFTFKPNLLSKSIKVAVEDAHLINVGETTVGLGRFTLRALKNQEKIKEVFEEQMSMAGIRLAEDLAKEKGKEVKRIWIEDGKLKVEFKQ